MSKPNLLQSMSKAVNEIYLAYGEVKPSVLVDEAQPEDSPIHSAFEWDDFKAGREYRLMQARGYIRRVTITIEDRDERLIHIPQVEVIDDNGDMIEPTGREGCYKPISVVVRDHTDYDRAMDQVRSQMAALRRSYDELKGAYKDHCQRNQGKLELEHIPDFPRADHGFEEIMAALT